MAYDFPNTPTTGQVFQGFTWDGEKWVSTVNVPSTSGVIRIAVFTASGTYTPSASMTTCVIECVGGGGGGGSSQGATSQVFCGSGGGSGGYSRTFATAATIGPSQAVTVGPGGLGGAAGSNNGASPTTDTSVGTLCIAKGGGGGKFGSAAQSPSAGIGGISGTGDVAAAGAPGGPGFYNNASQPSVVITSGAGGSSVFGGGAPGVSGAAAAGANGANYGGGGSGAQTSNSASGVAGGNGAPGVVIITEYGMTALTAGAAQGSVRYDLPQGLTTSQMAQARANIGASVGIPDVIVEEQQASGVNGGASTAGAWFTRVLNTLVRNVNSIAALATNQVTLGAGTYYFTWSAPCGLSDTHQTRLFNVTDSAVAAYGTAEYATGANNVSNRSFGSIGVTIAASKAFRIEHRVTASSANTGALGVSNAFGNILVYSRLEITKLN